MEKKYGMVINLKRCIGCHTCSIACKAEHNIPKGSEIACVGVTHLRVRQEKKHPSVRNFTTFFLYIFLLYPETVFKVVRAHNFYCIRLAA
jgi:Fe-S-cluster-containing dehydrogenase component